MLPGAQSGLTLRSSQRLVGPSRAEDQARAERAAAQLRFLDTQLRRQRDLASVHSISASQLEQNEADRDVAASDLRIAELRIGQIDEQLERAVVRAQFDGVMVERLRREGEDVSRGAVLGRFTDTAHLEVRVFAPLRYAGRVQPGVPLRLFGFETEHEGRVRAVVPSADVRSRTFELRMDLSKAAETKWSIGQLVSVGLPVDAGSETLAVPRDALVLRQEGEYV